MLDLNARHSLSIAQGQFGEAAVSTYHQARLGINIPTRYGDPQAYDSANMRFFEILKTGTPLVTPAETYLLDLEFQHGHNLFLYESRQHLADVIQEALLRDDLETIGFRGAAIVNLHHSYRNRAQQVLAWLS